MISSYYLGTILILITLYHVQLGVLIPSPRVSFFTINLGTKNVQINEM